MEKFELRFAMPMKLRDDACSAWDKYRKHPVYLIGWCDSAYSFVGKLGDYNIEFVSGHPSALFEICPTPRALDDGQAAVQSGQESLPVTSNA